jgi:predicted RNA-binding protein with PIN domain
MPYLVDGNNVMCQRVGWHKDKRRARRELMEDVARYKQNKGISLSIVFDGAPDDSFPDGSLYQGITIFYARVGSNADERIKTLVEASKQKQTLIVVTSDRELASYVRRCGVRVIASGEFRASVDRVEESRGLAQPKVEAPDEGWLRYFGADQDD